MTDTSRASQPTTIITAAVISAALGITGGAGVTHFSVPALEGRIDKLEATKVLMEYQIQELRKLVGKECQGRRYSALASEKITD